MSESRTNKIVSQSAKEHMPEAADIVNSFMEIRSALMKLASRYLKKNHEIEDVVQEACVKALEAQSKTRIRSPKAYLFRSTKNIALKEIAKSASRLTDNLGDLSPETVLPEETSLEDQLESRERFELFCRAVRSLPLKCQRAFILRKVYGFSPKEIAEQLDISVKTVESHLTRGLIRCTEYMDNEESKHQTDVEKIDNVSLRGKGANG